MPRPLSFFKVYGPPFDPAREARRRASNYSWALAEPPYIADFHQALCRILDCYYQRNCGLPKSMPTNPGFYGSKPNKFWANSQPVLCAVDWSPPQINPHCRFQHCMVFGRPYFISFA